MADAPVATREPQWLIERRRKGASLARELPLPGPPATLDDLGLSEAPAARPWTDERGRRLYPLRMPEIVCDPDVFVPYSGERPHQVRLSGGDASSDSYCFPND